MSAGNNSHRAVKNTFFLYFRMILIMLVSLYTVRVVLGALGVVDYGIYNVIAGVVTSLSFFSASLSGACQRFFSFEIGCDDKTKLKEVFSISITIFLFLSFLIILILETVGLWFLNNKLVIPPERLVEANYVYQFSILSFLISIITVPFNSLLIAQEQMKLYAYIGIAEVILKLIIAFILLFVLYDKLLVYGFLTLLSTFFVSFITILYTKKKFEEAKRIKLVFEIEKIKPLLSYSGWNVIGAFASIIKNNGVNILINMFFGPAINTARGISMQINSTVSSFITNIYIAVRPQMTKAYATKEYDYFFKLTLSSAKLSYYLLLILAIPLIFETSLILKIWLKDVPDYTTVFTKLLIINLLLESITNQLYGAIQATGKIKMYQIIYCPLLLLILPFTYILYKLGADPESTYYLSIILTFIGFVPQVILTNKIVGMPSCLFIKKVFIPVFVISALCLIIPLLITQVMNESVMRLLCLCIFSTLFSLLIIYFIGLNKEEKSLIIHLFKKYIHGK